MLKMRHRLQRFDAREGPSFFLGVGAWPDLPGQGDLKESTQPRPTHGPHGDGPCDEPIRWFKVLRNDLPDNGGGPPSSESMLRGEGAPLGAPTASEMAPARDERKPLTGQSPDPE